MIREKYKWIKKNNSENSGNNKSVDQIINDILEERGILSPEDKDMFLSPDLDKMHDPMKLPDMDKAVARLIRARGEKEKITIYGDYDVDGITSTSILYMFLVENGYQVDYYIPDRVSEGYGFNTDALAQIRESGTTLLISVDTGISANAEVDFATSIGLDIIITDHHECLPDLPKAHAIINPKRVDSNYPFKELAGVGVAFKLIHALAISFNNVDTIWKYIDIVAIGTVADIVPLRDENRIIVKNAFKTMPTTWNLGLEALLEISGAKDKKISAGTIGFQIGPRLNAAGRLGDAKKGVELFTTRDPALALQIATDLDEGNKNRKAIEKEIYDLAVKEIEENDEIKSKDVIVVAAEGWHKGVIGIVASRITERYYKPSIIIGIEDGQATGSARSIEGFSLFDALCHSQDYLEKFGGHDMAAGLSMDQAKIAEFRDYINEYAKDIIDEDMLRAKIGIDYEIKEEHITLPMVEALENLEPYGVGNPTPVFSYQAKIYHVRAIGADGSHLKVQLYTPERLIDGIGFSMGDQSRVISKGEELMIAGNLQKNEWLGKVTPQIVIRDIKSLEDERAQSKYYLALYKADIKPTMENLQAFTKGGQVCYISSYEEYKNHLIYLLPTRDDAVAVYRYLKGLQGSKLNQCPIHFLKNDMKRDYMSEYKILNILDIFQELGLLAYAYHDDSGMISFNLQDGVKTDLLKSKRYRQLSALNEISI